MTFFADLRDISIFGHIVRRIPLHSQIKTILRTTLYKQLQQLSCWHTPATNLDEL